MTTDNSLPVFADALRVIRSSRARRFRLAVNPRDGHVQLTLPQRAPLAEALRWAHSKRGWIEAQLRHLPPPCPVTDQMRFDLAGRTVRLDWSPHHLRTPRLVDDRLEIGGPAEQLSLRLLRWLKAEARALLTCETREFAAKLGVSVAAVRIADPLSRWGSCASSGRISYSWRLILAPDHVRRATVAHEVAHRVHMNHGPEFHRLVATLLGSDPKPARLWLARNGAALHRFGRAS